MYTLANVQEEWDDGGRVSFYSITTTGFYACSHEYGGARNGYFRWVAFGY